MRPPSRSRRLTSPGRIGIEPTPVPAPRERPAPGRDAVAAGCSGEQRHAAAAADGAGQAPTSSPDTPPVRSAPIAQHRRLPSGFGSGLGSPPPLAAEHPVEGTGELGVVVAHQESDRQLLLLQVNRKASCPLGLDSSAIGTLVERTTRFTMLPLHAQLGDLAAKPAQLLALAGGQPRSTVVGRSTPTLDSLRRCPIPGSASAAGGQAGAAERAEQRREGDDHQPGRWDRGLDRPARGRRSRPARRVGGGL
jgi:hypothetical protein